MAKFNWKKAAAVTGVALGAAFVGLTVVAKKKKGSSVYDDAPEEKNPLEGQKVVFVEDENDPENADGARGHLEPVGASEYTPSFYEDKIKRALDVTLSFGGLVALSPIYAAISLAIVIDDPGPVLFTQKRIGQDKQYFKLHKFRSMKMCTPHDVPTHMLENPDQYITKVGKFIRAHSLDELPQIWDIFIGNMSVIGPRPALWNQDVLTAERDKYNANDVKPGLTGWAQINGRDAIELDEKARLDGEYVEELNSGNGFKADVKCFLGTVSKVGHDDSVVEGGTGEMEKIGRHYADGKSDEELIGNIGFGEAVEVDLAKEVKVLVTGAGSYIGESFKAYAEEHYGENLTVDSVDMLDPDWRETDFAPYDVVYHVAEIAHADVGNVSDEVKENCYAVNTDLAIEVAEKAKAAGVGEYIFMSSMIVYGDSAPFGQEKIVDETTVPVPANFYGDSKLQADVAVRDLADDSFKVIVLRPPMIYGKGSKGNYPTLAKLAKLLPVFPDVDNERSMLHIDNLCEFLCQIMLVKKFERNSVVLIPQNAEYTRTADMVKDIADVTGKKTAVTGILNPAVKVGSKVPGKVKGLVNKAFGNSCYAMSVSEYAGIDYRVKSLKESIEATEGEVPPSPREFVDNKLKDLKGKKILLVGLPGYPDGIIKKMKELGAEVDYIHDKPDEGFATKSLGRIGVGFYQDKLNDYYKLVLTPLKDRDYDFVLVLRGEYTPVDSIKLLREYYPNAKMVLYIWDGLNKLNTKGIEKKWPYFDRVYTFDRVDYEANKDQISFLPLYYYDEYLPAEVKSANAEDLQYDISFIGTGHDDRIRIIKNLMEQGKKEGLNVFSYFYMPHKLVYLKNKATNGEFKDVSEKDINYEMLPFETLYSTYADSRCVVDVENKGQHGLTMRSIEILGLKRKFITTNKDIVNYDFYNPNNILVIDRENPVLDMEFFNKPYEELDAEIYKKYSIENWVLEVLK